MNRTKPLSREILDPLLIGVDKPARYSGGEVGSVIKGDDLSARMALCFPDVYEVAESHLGLKILYDVINRRKEFAAERVYGPWPDFEARLRAAELPLFSLETHRPLAAFDVVGFTLQFELAYPMVVAMLELGSVPPRTRDRGPDDPFVIGGGACSFNPEPIADFFDAFLLGDGEDAVVEMLSTVAAGRARAASRAEILIDLARIEGVYVPSHFEVEYNGMCVSEIKAVAGTPHEDSRSRHGTPRVRRRVLADLDAAPFPTRPVVPNLKPIHDRVSIEIQRGCTQGCRFCQAGMITRPTRQRRPETVLRLADEALESSGSGALGLLSLSAGDYGPINELVGALLDRCAKDRVSVSLPSMRTETMTPELAEQLAKSRKAGFTFAPEAGSERLRRVINKTNNEEDLLDAVRSTIEAGWKQLKFYFMIGLPTETDADIEAIVTLSERALRVARSIKSNATVNVSVSTFVPKPHTPFQWEAQIGIDETRRKQSFLRAAFRRKKIGFRYHSPEQSFLEGVLSRGDRRLSDAVEKAAQAGCRLDAWTEHYVHSRWTKAFTETLEPHGLSAAGYLEARNTNAFLPWEHLDAGMLRKFLLRDRGKAREQSTNTDCAFEDHCYACGGCDLGDPYLPPAKRTERNEAKLRPRTTSAGVDLSAVLPSIESTSGRTVSTAKIRSRIRFRYAKQDRGIHLSHLDGMEHLIRAVRQSGLPVLYSEGHSPRPRIGFSPACPSGIESDAEFFEVECAGFPNPRRYFDRLVGLLPVGLTLLEATEVPIKAPAFNQQLTATTYSAALSATVDIDRCREKLSAFLSASVYPVRVLRKRKPKLMDARGLVEAATLVDRRLRVDLLFRSSGSLKIAEAVTLLVGKEALIDARIRKESVCLAGPTAVEEVGTPDIATLDIDAAEAHDLTDLIAERAASISSSPVS